MTALLIYEVYCSNGFLAHYYQNKTMGCESNYDFFFEFDIDVILGLTLYVSLFVVKHYRSDNCTVINDQLQA